MMPISAIILVVLLAASVLVVWLLRKSKLIIAIPLSILLPQFAVYLFIKVEGVMFQASLCSGDASSGAPMLEVIQFTLGIPASLVCLVLLVIFKKLYSKPTEVTKNN